MFSKLRGSSLLTALIFSFVLMVIVFAIAYSFRISSLTIGALIDEEQNINIDDGYIKNLADSGSLATSHEETIDNFRFETIPNSMTPKFYINNTNAALYGAEPFLFSYEVTHNFYNNGVNDYIKNIIFNTLSNNTYTQYSDDIYPINVPYVNTAIMLDSVYRFSNNDGVAQLGFIGYIQKNNSSLSINADGTNTVIDIPSNLLVGNYKFSIGWDLKAGSWNVFVAVYDSDRVYTASTSLTNIVSNSAQAKIDLEDWKEVLISTPTGGTISSSNTVLSKWYYDSDSDVPKLLIIKKESNSAHTSGYSLGIYGSTYDSLSKVYSSDSTLYSSVESNSDFDVTKVFVVVPDINFGLDISFPLIFQKDGSVTKVFQFNLHSSGGATFLGNLSPTVDSEPVLVKKNATQNYLIYKNDTSGFFGHYYYYAHEYSSGTLNTTAISPIRGVSGIIQKLIPKFGALFIVTSNNIYLDDFNISTDELVNRIAISSSNYQFLRDSDGDIYAIQDGLACEMNNNCDQNNRLYIRTEANCSTFAEGCNFIDDLNNIGSYLGVVYKNLQH